jgi:AcrR family transcriptional regulator
MVGATAEDSRELLIGAAVEGIATHGYDRVRLRDVSAIAGVTTGMIQHYFASREDLLLAAIERLGTEQIEAARRICRDEPDPWQRLTALIEQVAAGPDGERRCAVWLELCASAARDTRIRASLVRVTREWREHLTATIRDGVAAGVFIAALDQDELANVLMAAIDGCEMSVGSGAGVVDAHGARRILLHLAATLTGIDLRGVGIGPR